LHTLFSEISQISYIPGTRATHVALTRVATALDNDRKAGLRQEVPKKVIVLLAGSSDMPAQAAIVAATTVTPQATVYALGEDDGDGGGVDGGLNMKGL
jgi:hypothetical protein